MSELRQSNLFAAEDWKLIYKAFSNIDFTAYDFDTIRSALVDYIRINYPENFTDYTENDEFIFILDILAYLAQSLSFRFELNARENFIDTAERRESILRLAKLINYQAKRNYPARGLIKISQITINEDILDSNGVNIRNIPIKWDDPANPDWFEHFILAMNAAFVANNQFGQPVKVGSVGGIKTYLYQFNNVPYKTVTDSFTTAITGTTTQFEIVNSDFDDLGTFKEKEPNPASSKYIIYRTDGKGNASPDTGFFFYFKQGALSFEDFKFEVPIENRMIDIPATNINELDVWVQEISDTGSIIKSWSKVPAVENISYNSLGRTVRETFSVLTNDNDRISIKFPDGRIGKAPVGVFRVWYRTSNGLRYQIKSQDMRGISIDIPYIRNTSLNEQQEYNINLVCDLQYTVSNSQPKETTEQIRRRAPAVFYTQNRMITGEDYNVYPLTGGNVLKIKSINRTYSGHSRYIDINDPTGVYNDTNLFADDGILYREYFNDYDEEALPTTKNNIQIVESRIVTKVSDIDLRNYFYDKYPSYALVGITWKRASGQIYSSTGRLWNGSAYITVGDASNTNAKYIDEGSVLLFTLPDTTTKWAAVSQLTGDGTALQTGAIGPIVLTEDIPDGSTLLKIVPPLRQTLTDDEKDDIQTEMESNQDFGLRYDPQIKEWVIITNENLDKTSPFSLTYAGDTTETHKDASWLILVQYNASFWSFTARDLRYVYESERYVRFFFYNKYKTIDPQTGLVNKDFIKILKINNEVDSADATGIDYFYNVTKSFVFDDGYIEPRRIQISPADRDDDGVPDNPYIFKDFVDPDGADQTKRLVFYKKYIDEHGYEYWKPIYSGAPYQDINIHVFNTTAEFEAYGNYSIGDIAYVVDQGAFYEITGIFPTTYTNVTNSGEYKKYSGRRAINFQWKHFAPADQRIDPAISNIIDIFVLTSTYNTEVQEWVKSVNRGEFPESPSTQDLKIEFEELESIKAVSDQIIWRSAKFKLLFGEGAIPELQAKFKVVKIPGTTATDNEIKQKVIESIDEFFNINNWNFGESFYYTELASYIHQKLATQIASIVIVPMSEDSKFGNLFEVRNENDELFLSTARVSDIQIIPAITNTNIRIGS